MRKWIAALSVLALLPFLPVRSVNAEEGFTPLFDGQTLSGWEGDTKIFRVADEAIEAGSLKEKIARNEFLCTTKEYGDFELRLRAKLVGEGQNAGIQFRSQRVPNHHEVAGFQCDMGGAAAKPIWGWLYDESRRNRFLVSNESAKLAEVVKTGEFNDVVIRCEGPSIKIWVNGFQTVDYTEPDDKIARRGIIGLQIHGGAPAQATYRDIRIQELGQ